jgi:formylglycine-generating enzyme required for sulfatase activity
MRRVHLVSPAVVEAVVLEEVAVAVATAVGVAMAVGMAAEKHKVAMAEVEDVADTVEEVDAAVGVVEAMVATTMVEEEAMEAVAPGMVTVAGDRFIMGPQRTSFGSFLLERGLRLQSSVPLVTARQGAAGTYFIKSSTLESH